MAQDLVAQIVQGLGPGTVDRISAALGIDPGTAQKAVNGAVPAILGSLVGLVSQPEGGERLSGILGQLGQSAAPEGATPPIGQAAAPGAAEQGSALLSSLLGGQGVDGLVGALTRYAGLDQGTAGRLLGIVAPLALGVLGRQARATGAGPGDLAAMLLGQKDAIAAALPAALAGRLRGSGLLSGIVAPLAQGTAAIGAMGAAPRAGGSTTRGRLPGWLWGLAAVAIIVIGAYWLWGRGEIKEASRAPVETTAGTVGSGTSTAAGQLDLGRQVTSAVDKARATLEQVNDPASAKRALPQLDDMVAQLDRLRGAAGQAPEQQRRAVADMAGKAQPGLDAAIDRALATPGVAEVLQPTLGAFKTKLAALRAA